MKRTKCFLSILLLWMTAHTAHAQGEFFEYGYFNHVGVGASLGLDGIGFDVAAPLGYHFALRTGVSFMPKIKYEDNFDLNQDDPDITDKVDAKATLNVCDFKFLADIYPAKWSSFHFTVGAFIGSKHFLKATNTSMFIKDPAKYGRIGLTIGDYRVTTDENGYAKASVVVNSFKPYVGIGFGRAVPKKRIGVSFDFGLKFWGKPALGAETLDDWGEKSFHKFKYTELNEDDDEDLKDGLKTASKVIAFPVLTLRLTGRIL